MVNKRIEYLTLIRSFCRRHWVINNHLHFFKDNFVCLNITEVYVYRFTWQWIGPGSVHLCPFIYGSPKYICVNLLRVKGCIILWHSNFVHNNKCVNNCNINWLSKWSHYVLYKYLKQEQYSSRQPRLTSYLVTAWDVGLILLRSELAFKASCLLPHCSLFYTLACFLVVS